TLVRAEIVVPEFLQTRCTPENLAASLSEIVADTPARRRQVEAFGRLDGILGADDAQPSERAAQAVLDLLGGARAGAPRPGAGGRAGVLPAAGRHGRGAGWRPYRAGAADRSSGAGPRSSPSTGRSSRPCARAQTGP